MPADAFTPPPGWEGVEATLAELRVGTSALGEFIDQQWRELQELHEELEQRSRDLASQEREVQCRAAELAAALELAKVQGELAEARCELLRQSPRGPDETEEALLAAWARIAELEQQLSASHDKPRPRGGKRRLPVT